MFFEIFAVFDRFGYDNVPSFQINSKNQDSLSINMLNNINIDDEIPIIVEENGSRAEKVESDIHFYLI